MWEGEEGMRDVRRREEGERVGVGGGEGKNERRREEGEGVGWEERRGEMRVGGGVRRVRGWGGRRRGKE